MDQAQKIIVILPGRGDSLETVVKLLAKHKNRPYFAYEREDVWHLGLGSSASLFVDAEGKTATITVQDKEEKSQITESLSDVARSFVAKFARTEGMIFGHAGFNYGCHVREQVYKPGQWPLLSLMIPSTEITFKPHQITVSGQNEKHVHEVCDIIKSAANVDLRQPQPVYTMCNKEQYKAQVSEALAEISAGQYKKIIVSRAVDLKERVDIPATLLHGRLSNTPARAFSMSHGGFEATGFSPELVAAVINGKAITEPLAGTRSRIGTEEEVKRLGEQLIHDGKEILEHVISVKEAITELNRVCAWDTVAVEDFMSIKHRGSVQHLGSRVTGRLSQEADAWSAFDVLFPSITASGIPKDSALQAISRLETRPRELYSGAILLLDGKDFFEATLCLRTVFQDPTKQWIQAGAGIISQSTPDRELTETGEKLASIAPYIVYESWEN